MKNYTYKSVKQRAANVEGAVTKDELRLLYNLAEKTTSHGQIVEIGSFKGKSTIFLASGSMQKSNKVYAIDPHQGGHITNKKFSGPTYKMFKKNIKDLGLTEKVVAIKKYSFEAIERWRQPIGLLFIDGNHSYRAVKQDVLLWEPFIVDGGLIVFHDVLNPAVGPAKAIHRHIFNKPRYCCFGVIDSLFYGIKKTPDSLKEKVNYFFYANVIRLIAWLLGSTKSSTPKKIRKLIRQYIVKRWLKTLLTFITRVVN